jgi:SPP1 gp7 family putative phage head morphogenesis protein
MVIKAPKRTWFKPSMSVETQFARSLRKVARHAGHIIDAHVDGAKIENEPEMQAALKAYSKLLDPWAKRQAKKMLEQVSKANLKTYRSKTKEMLKDSHQIHRLLRENASESVNTRNLATALMDEQVGLIKSIPTRAGMRAQKLALEAVYNGTRASDIAEELAKSTNVSESQAMLIARTEVARANASFTQARAENVGARGYIWRTTMDGAERESHAKMNGKYVEYSKPPTLIDGTTGHAGTFPNCRCYQDVQFDDT